MDRGDRGDHGDHGSVIVLLGEEGNDDSSAHSRKTLGPNLISERSSQAGEEVQSACG